MRGPLTLNVGTPAVVPERMLTPEIHVPREHDDWIVWSVGHGSLKNVGSQDHLDGINTVARTEKFLEVGGLLVEQWRFTCTRVGG